MILEPMTMKYADALLEMKNYPETRAAAIIAKNRILKSDHYKWLEENIQYFQRIVGIGFIRIQNNEISIWIDRIWWGKGMATEILKRISKKGMTAKIVASNIASMRAFINAGFKPVKFIDGYYIFQK